jgi:hypothetical protein
MFLSVNTMETYYDKSRKERILLDELFHIIYKKDFQYYHTDPYGYDEYDSVTMNFCDNSHIIKSTHIFEAKIRDTSYPTILLEKKKLQNLHKVAKRYSDSPVDIYYVSCHPDGSYVFKLGLVTSYQWNKEYHNISSTENKGTILKEVTYLDIKDAKKIDIKSWDIDRLDRVKESSKQIDTVIKAQKQTKCLFEYLIKND